MSQSWVEIAKKMAVDARRGIEADQKQLDEIMRQKQTAEAARTVPSH